MDYELFVVWSILKDKLVFKFILFFVYFIFIVVSWNVGIIFFLVINKYINVIYWYIEMLVNFNFKFNGIKII